MHLHIIYISALNGVMHRPKKTQNAYRLQNVKDSCRITGNSYQEKNLSSGSKAGLGIDSAFKRPNNNL